MAKKGFANNIIYYLFCGFTGVVISLIIWLFLRAMNLGINLIWNTIPKGLNFKYYPMIVCTVGGLIIGIYQKFTKAVPEELSSVMAKVKKDKFYPYNKVFLLFISALLPLIFGGSIGPEAGLTGIIVGLCYWAGSHMKDAKNRIPSLMDAGISATLSVVFCAPLFGLFSTGEKSIYSESDDTGLNPSKKISNIIAVICAFGTIYIMNLIFGSGGGLPRIGGYTITNKERLWGIPLALLGVILGILFVLLGKSTRVVFEKLQGKCGIIISATLGGIILGVAGTYLPLVMFSGEESMNELITTYKQYAPWLLIGSGVLKILITNICIKSGWKGGNFFPLIFCGVAIGYGVAMLSGLDPAFCAAVITAGTLGAVIKKPFAVSVLLLMCFDIRVIPWILVASFIGSIVPNNFKKEKENEKAKISN